jgi:hypothetical protein
MVTGFRHDRQGSEFHAAFEFMSGRKKWVADRDKIWPADEYPFCTVDGKHLLATVPTTRNSSDYVYDIRRRIEDLEGRPFVFDAGIWVDGLDYQKGAGVSYRGSYWIAQQDTTQKPGDGPDWRLAVKRGRNGKDAPTRHRQQEQAT